MYRVYCDDVIIYDSKIDNLVLTDMKIELELNKTGTFTFSIYPDHFAYNSMNKLKSIIKVYQDDFLMFRGRILNDEIGFHNEKQVICEGELAFLLDSIQRPFDYSGTVEGFFKQMISNHNSQVEASKRFTIGNITVSEESFSRNESEHMNTLNVLQTKLLDTIGGYIVIRHEGNTNFIDYVEYFSILSTQKITFGKNLIDMKLKRSGEDIATAVIPLGAKDDETGQRIDIKSVNNNVDYVYNQEAVNSYGWIFKTAIFDDVTTASYLLKKGNEFLSQQISIVNSLDLSAADLATIDSSVNSFKVGTYVRVTTEPHSIDQNFLVDRISIDLLNPANNQLTLGTRFLTLTEKQSNIYFIKGNPGKKGDKGDPGDVAEVHVGGRNLIPNTKTMSGYLASSNVTFENDAEGFAVATFARTTLGWNSVNTMDAIPFSVVRGKQVTFSFYVRSDDAEAMTEYNYGMVIGFALCTANSYSRIKYRTQNFYNKKMSSDWEKITWTANLTDDFFSSGTGTIEDDTRLYLQVYDYSPYSMQVKQIKLEFGNVATDWSPSFEDLADNERIIELERNFNTSIQQNADSILQQVNEDYYLKDNAEALVQSINTRFTQTSEEFEFRFNQFHADIEDVASGADAQFQEISKYIRFVNGNIILGESGNELTLKIENDQITFFDGFEAVAYFSNGKLYVTEGEFTNSLRLGNFAFNPRSNGNLSLAKVV